MNRWKTLFEDFREHALQCLSETVQHGNIVPVSDSRPVHKPADSDKPAFVAYEYPDKPVRFLAIGQTNPKEERIEIVSGFPFLQEGEPNIFELLDVVPEEGGSEGTIECVSQCGDSFFFFEPLLCHARAELKVGQKYEFSVAGIAYFLEHVARPEFVIESGPALEAERQRVLEEDPTVDLSTITSVTFSTATLRCLIPREEPGDAEFQTAVENVQWFDLAGTRVCKMRCLFRGSDENEWAVSLYASDWILQGYEPQKGDNIRGVMWMQARPIREVASEESWIDRGSEGDASMEGFLRAIQAREYFSDLSPGAAAMGSVLVGAGWDVTKCRKEPGQSEVPDLVAVGRNRQINIWVNACLPETEKPAKIPGEIRKRLSETGLKKGQEVVFATVRCRMVENYLYYEFDEKDQLEAVFGNLSFIEAERMPGSQDQVKIQSDRKD